MNVVAMKWWMLVSSFINLLAVRYSYETLAHAVSLIWTTEVSTINLLVYYISDPLCITTSENNTDLKQFAENIYKHFCITYSNAYNDGAKQWVEWVCALNSSERLQLIHNFSTQLCDAYLKLLSWRRSVLFKKRNQIIVWSVIAL